MISRKSFSNTSELRYSCFGILFLILLGACQKPQEFDETDNATFIRVFGTGESGYITVIQEIEEGNILGVGGNQNDEGYRKYILDKSGNKKEEVLDKNSALIYPTSLKLKSGETMVADRFSPFFHKYAANGSLLLSQQFSASPKDGEYSRMYQREDGSILIGFSAGAGPSDETRIIQLDASGKTLQNRLINLPSGRRILRCKIVGSYGSKVIIAGNVFAKTTGWRYTDRWKHFSAIYDLITGQIEKEVLYDQYDNSEEDGVEETASFNDGAFATLVSSANQNELLPRREFEIFKTDQELNLIWRKRYDIGAVVVFPWSMFSTKDGGMLVYGYCTTSASSTSYGFMLKINAEGEIIAKQIYSFTQNMAVLAGTESEDGKLIFGGVALSFGQGKDSGSPLIFKTDALGNME